MKIEIVDYSEKAIVVIGDTKPFKDQLRAMNGRFNPYLKGATQFKGWVFSKKRENQVRDFVSSLIV